LNEFDDSLRLIMIAVVGVDIIIKGVVIMRFTVDYLTGDTIKSVHVDAANQKEAKIKIKKKLGKEKIVGVKVQN